MYCLQMDIHPTSGLTFRRMPSSILHISTYPFLPPSTMSGWLRRLMMLRRGVYPETEVKNPPTYVLPRPPYHVLGAYPEPHDACRIHTTYRHGPRVQHRHTFFSKLQRESLPTASQRNVVQLQLHTWEYLFTERLRGYVVSEETAPLEALQSTVNLGCKLGKEGYGYLESVSQVQELVLERASAMPNVLVPASALVGMPSTIYALYRHEHDGGISLRDDSTDGSTARLTDRLTPRQPLRQAQERPREGRLPKSSPNSDPSAGSVGALTEVLGREVPNPVAGFVPFRAGWPDRAVELDYWTDGETFIPQATLDEL